MNKMLSSSSFMNEKVLGIDLDIIQHVKSECAEKIKVGGIK